MKKGKSGFTLLELLVVVGILAALVALALPFYQDYVSQSKITAAGADLQTFKKALAMYDQLEPKLFNDTRLLPLIGKYLQDYRTTSTQENPVDPWNNDYIVNSMEGVLYSMGPNGRTDSTITDRVPGGDDILVTWKPPFIVSSAQAVNNTTVEIVFSRKVIDLSGAAAGYATMAPVATGNIQKISDTIYRFKVGALTAGTEYTLTIAGVTAQDNKASFNKRPEDNVTDGGIVKFTY
ncbi:MAG TPA: hypothetical protein DCG57_01545 [Candidatus Riflebacteria bacterium]|nr:hypothetical protein [Candidatus Riflebacteria bacterium]